METYLQCRGADLSGSSPSGMLAGGRVSRFLSDRSGHIQGTVRFLWEHVEVNKIERGSGIGLFQCMECLASM